MDVLVAKVGRGVVAPDGVAVRDVIVIPLPTMAQIFSFSCKI
jgi:hypothetical protein